MNDPRMMREIDRLHRDMARLRAQVPVRVPPSGTTAVFRVVTVGGGNTLVTSQDGIVQAGVASVPSAYDPDTEPTTVDGIGWGILYEDGLEIGHVLIVNDGTGGYPDDLLINDRVIVIAPKSILVGAGPATVSAWVVGYV